MRKMLVATTLVALVAGTFLASAQTSSTNSRGNVQPGQSTQQDTGKDKPQKPSNQQ